MNTNKNNYIQLIFSISILYILINGFITTVGFKEEQLKSPRVKESYNEKETLLKNILAKQHLNFNNLNIFIRIFKQEGILEVWGAEKNKEKFCLIKSYPICSKSGELGPKRRQGDLQVPEGYYYINAFNPNSNYYLSMMINYPNASDEILGEKNNLGNKICIHGNCVTIGCVPITDDLIKEVYILALEAKNNGQVNIPVHIFPFQLNAVNLKLAEFEFNKQLFSFWKNLKLGYDAFEKSKTIPQIKILSDGRYEVMNNE